MVHHRQFPPTQNCKHSQQENLGFIQTSKKERREQCKTLKSLLVGLFVGCLLLKVWQQTTEVQSTEVFLCHTFSKGSHWQTLISFRAICVCFSERRSASNLPVYFWRRSIHSATRKRNLCLSNYNPPPQKKQSFRSIFFWGFTCFLEGFHGISLVYQPQCLLSRSTFWNFVFMELLSCHGNKKNQFV